MRFDDENCVGLCRKCHMEWELRKNNEYKRFMLDRLGRERYEMLEWRARLFKQRKEAVREARAWLSLLGKG